MAYVNMKEMLDTARSGGYAVGAFNIFNYASIKAAIDTAEEMCSPIILQTSVKTVKQMGAEEMARIIIPMAKNANVPVALHLDHCKDVAFAKKCLDAGWNAVMYDGSSFSLEQNLAESREVVKYAKGFYATVEGEIGAIAGVEEDIVVKKGEEALADPEIAVRYASESGIDVFAPAIGTAHGVYKGEPKLDFDRFVEIRDRVSQPLVVHGGTGLAPDVFRHLIGLGAAKINVSTALKVAYQEALPKAAQHKEPLAADNVIYAGLCEAIRYHIEIFGSAGKAGEIA